VEKRRGKKSLSRDVSAERRRRLEELQVKMNENERIRRIADRLLSFRPQTAPRSEDAKDELFGFVEGVEKENLPGINAQIDSTNFRRRFSSPKHRDDMGDADPHDFVRTFQGYIKDLKATTLSEYGVMFGEFHELEAKASTRGFALLAIAAAVFVPLIVLLFERSCR
jgi:hypothetical protein